MLFGIHTLVQDSQHKSIHHLVAQHLAHSYSGISNWLLAVGFTSVTQIYFSYILSLLLASISILLGFITSSISSSISQQAPFSSSSFIFGLLSISWCGHLVHVAIPIHRGASSLVSSLRPFFSGHWSLYSNHIDSSQHILGSLLLTGQSILSFSGTLNRDTCSLIDSDITHHHLALGILFIWSAQMYSPLVSNIHHRLHSILVAHNNVPFFTSMLGSAHLQLSLALFTLGILSSVTAQHLYSLAPYSYLAYDYPTTVALYTHHSWISSFLIIGSFAHGGIFLIRDYSQVPNDIFSFLSTQSNSCLSSFVHLTLFRCSYSWHLCS